MARDTDALKVPKWAASGDVEDPASGSLPYAGGWTSTYSSSGGALPKREHFNWLFLVLGALGVEINEHGILEWSGTPAYGHPAVVFGSDDVLYISVQDSTNQDPTTDTSDTYWKSLLGTADVDKVDGKHVWTGTEAEYSAITNKDADTLYFRT